MSSVKWAEFKEAWRKASKTEKQDVIMNLVGLFGSTGLTLLGACQFSKYADVLGSDYRYAIGGAFITACGLWAMELIYILIERRRIEKLEERIEKLEEETHE